MIEYFYYIFGIMIEVMIPIFLVEIGYFIVSLRRKEQYIQNLSQVKKCTLAREDLHDWKDTAIIFGANKKFYYLSKKKQQCSCCKKKSIFRTVLMDFNFDINSSNPIMQTSREMI